MANPTRRVRAALKQAIKAGEVPPELMQTEAWCAAYRTHDVEMIRKLISAWLSGDSEGWTQAASETLDRARTRQDRPRLR
jgi:hypothetical protein